MDKDQIFVQPYLLSMPHKLIAGFAVSWNVDEFTLEPVTGVHLKLWIRFRVMRDRKGLKVEQKGHPK